MRKLIEFQILDKNAEEYDVDLALLMNKAGFSVAKHIINNYDVDKIITIVCGSGNNGGDGFVAANILIERGFKVNILISASPKSKIAQKAYSSLLCDVCHLDNLSDFKEYTDILLDCLLGSGLKGEVRPPLDQYIVSMNEFSKIISVDVPSGIGTSCSIVPGSTVTFHDHKSILNESNSGEIILVDIGFPKIVDNLTGPGELLLFPNLDGRKHKGQNGKVAIVGGGAFSGAPALAAMGSYRSGSDLVHVFVPESSYESVSTFIPELIVHKLEGDIVDSNNIKTLFDNEFDSIVIGPGMGKNPESLEAVQLIIDKCDNLVIDADAIKLYDFNSKNIIMTPHKGEIERLGISSEDQEIINFAAKNDLTIILKGETDYITNGIYFKQNRTGHPRMAVGGTGDILAGFLGTLLAKGLTAYESGRLASYSLGLAGEMAYNEIGPGFLPTDLGLFLSKVLRIN